MIGTVGMAPTLYIAKNTIGNVPTAYPLPRSRAGDLTAYADELFFRKYRVGWPQAAGKALPTGSAT